MISLNTGISVPFSYEITENSARVSIFAHGLGTSDPFKRGMDTDRWVELLKKTVTPIPVNVVTYTARGHGKSTGWEGTAEDDPSQFTWKYLASDMLAVADYFQISRFVAGGSSMGAATSLYAAIYNPDRISALILIRPPTAWKERADRRKHLLAAADKMEERIQPDTDYSQLGRGHLVLRGAAHADLPPLDSELYGKISHIPTLILTIRDDPAHPVSTAETLHKLLPQSTLSVMDTPDDAAAAWPALIIHFLQALQ